MKQIGPGMWMYTAEEFEEEQKEWADDDGFKHFEPNQNFVIITDDGQCFDSDGSEAYEA